MIFAKKNILIFYDTPLLMEIFINTFQNIIYISTLVRNFSTSFQQFFLHFFFLFLLILFLFIYYSFTSSTGDFNCDFWYEICSDFNIDFRCFFKNKKSAVDAIKPSQNIKNIFSKYYPHIAFATLFIAR